MSRFAFTLCKALGGKRAAKKITGRLDGSRETLPYDRIREWLFHPVEIDGLHHMADCLARLAPRPDLMIVMGAPRPGLDLARPQLRRWADPDACRNTLADVPRGWLAVDVDGYDVPPGWGLADRLPDAAAAIRDDGLDESFWDVACVVTATASTGLVEDVARLRLFFALDRPHSIATLHGWARGAQVAGLPVDPSVLQCGQPLYTARPVFAGTLRDPVPPRHRAFVLPGRYGAVALDPHRHAAAAAETERRIRAVEQACGGDWRRLLDDALGGPASYFAPLTTALGLAARTAEDEAGIVGWTVQLVGERADPARCQQYGPQWCAATLRRFRQRDGEARSRVDALRAQVFREDSHA